MIKIYKVKRFIKDKKETIKKVAIGAGIAAGAAVVGLVVYRILKVDSDEADITDLDCDFDDLVDSIENYSTKNIVNKFNELANKVNELIGVRDGFECGSDDYNAVNETIEELASRNNVLFEELVDRGVISGVRGY